MVSIKVLHYPASKYRTFPGTADS